MSRAITNEHVGAKREQAFVGLPVGGCKNSLLMCGFGSRPGWLVLLLVVVKLEDVSEGLK